MLCSETVRPAVVAVAELFRSIRWVEVEERSYKENGKARRNRTAAKHICIVEGGVVVVVAAVVVMSGEVEVYNDYNNNNNNNINRILEVSRLH